MRPDFLSSTERMQIAERLAALKNGQVALDSKDVCREIALLREKIRKFDRVVRNDRLTERLSTTGVTMTAGGPFMLVGVPVAVVAGFVLTIAGPVVAVAGWMASEDRELKLYWIKRMLDTIFDLALVHRCGVHA
jgi:hypothetical protein